MEMKAVRKLAGAELVGEAKAQGLFPEWMRNSVGCTMEPLIKGMLLRLQKYPGLLTDSSERKRG